MHIVEGRFRRIHNGVPYCAIVELVVATDVSSTSVVDDCSGGGWRAQGYIEEVPADGYDDWKAGARKGAEFALSVASQSALVVIRRIAGLTTDTNPSIAAAAAADAVSRGLTFTPPSEIVAAMESVVFKSWDRDFDFVPTVSELAGRPSQDGG
jgi:hypothetical protein